MNNSDLNMASCRNAGVSTDLFFEGFEVLTNRERLEVLAICDSCPVKSKCLQDALDHKETYGVWGGKFFRKGAAVSLSSIRRPRSKPAFA